MTFDASNRKEIRRLEKESAAADRARQAILRTIMSSTAGRAYIWSELGAAHVFETSFSIEPLQMAFREGERNAGLRLLADVISTSPDEFILAMREANARDSARQQPRSQDGYGGIEEPDASGDDSADDDSDRSAYN